MAVVEFFFGRRTEGCELKGRNERNTEPRPALPLRVKRPARLPVDTLSTTASFGPVRRLISGLAAVAELSAALVAGTEFLLRRFFEPRSGKTLVECFAATAPFLRRRFERRAKPNERESFPATTKTPRPCHAEPAGLKLQKSAPRCQTTAIVQFPAGAVCAACVLVFQSTTARLSPLSASLVL